MLLKFKLSNLENNKLARLHTYTGRETASTVNFRSSASGSFAWRLIRSRKIGPAGKPLKSKIIGAEAYSD